MPDAPGQVVDQSPIINDPFAEPARHWSFDGAAPAITDGRRASGYLPPGGEGGQVSITSEVVALALVNDMRDRVRRWRDDSYPGVTAVTRDLLDRWFDDERESGTRPYFAQREALETIVFLTEAPDDRRVGVAIPNTEAFDRWAVKMATGSGKTLVMAMTIAWSVLNKAANAQDTRFADAVLIMCPNLTVKQRLAGLDPHRTANEYEAFGLIPPNLQGLLGQARVLVTNWHQLLPETDPKRSVLRRGAESDAAFCRRVVEPKLGRKRRLLVLNDEAHHAYRHKPGSTAKRGEEADEAERATVWIDGLGRVHRDREILRCVDFSATPMYVPGSGHEPWTPFEWIVSDFALVDAIESGLVKIPRIPTDDNAGAAVPKYRNLWEHVKSALPRAKDDPDAGNPLVDYLTQVDGPLKQLAGEWAETFERWRDAGRPVPPTMIVICNDTKMAEVLEAHIGRKGEAGPELQNPLDGSTRTVRIDSRLLADAEARDDALSATDFAEQLRQIVATVGKEGEPGQDVRCLISVAMLSEGWDAQNVTQILGLRAFSSQLLCEQVIGRGLRRSSHDDLSQPEYVDVYGVPFELLPFAKAGPGRVIEPPRTTSVVARRDRAELEITFPRVVGIVNEVGSTLNVDWSTITAVAVSAENDPTRTQMKGIGTGEDDEQTHEFMWSKYRRQKLLFEIAARVLRGQDEVRLANLFPQALAAVQHFLETAVVYGKGMDERELDNELYKSQIAARLQAALRPSEDGSGTLLPVLDQYQPVGTTGTVAFQTAKPVEPTVRSHISHAVCDSELERHIARELEADERVLTYAKNDHLFCEIPYRFDGRTLRYLPDFLVRLAGDVTVLLEGKGRETSKDHAKQTASKRWVDAVNADGRWGRWHHAVIYKREEVRPLIDTVAVTAGV